MDVAIEVACARFAALYGTIPYLVGDEVLLSNFDRFSTDRRRRIVNFDAIFTYHHASNSQQIVAAGGG